MHLSYQGIIFTVTVYKLCGAQFVFLVADRSAVVPYRPLKRRDFGTGLQVAFPFLFSRKKKQGVFGWFS